MASEHTIMWLFPAFLLLPSDVPDGAAEPLLLLPALPGDEPGGVGVRELRDLVGRRRVVADDHLGRHTEVAADHRCDPVRVLLVHQWRNALLPLVTLLGLEFASLFSGALITETVFGWPGMGKLIADAVMGNDFNLALCALMLATAMTLLGSLLADLAMARLDPRIRLS